MPKYKAKVTHPAKGVAQVEFEPLHGGASVPASYYNSGDCPYKNGEEYDLDAPKAAEEPKVKKAKK